MTRGMLRQRMSLSEWADWVALYDLEARERKAEQDKARKSGGRNRRGQTSLAEARGAR
jgi:hypothetical protein